MKKIESNQKNVRFVYCPDPITLDKSKSWGQGNIQRADNGAFLKLTKEGTVSNLVQPNSDKSAPIGWIASRETQEKGFFDKKPIFLDDSKVFQPNEQISLDTLDGKMNYSLDKPFVIVYNTTDKGEIDQQDCWVMTLENLSKNYLL